jgi:glycosyltransferase involved in cell wall biosynthesis
MTPRISVVIPTYWRDDLLAKCLHALARQDLDPHQFEIVIADDAACDSTRRMLAEFGDPSLPRIVYVPVTEAHGPAAARNAGWRASQAEFLAFTDDDCEPEPDWLAAGLAALENGADAVSGRVVVPLPERPTDYERDVAGLARAEFVTANCFCRKSALLAIGGFDKSFRAAWREDSDLQFSLLESGFSIIRENRATVTHPVRPAHWGISLWQQKKSVYESLLYKKHRQLYRQRIGRLPAGYYASVAALGTAVASAMMSAPTLLLTSLGVWTALTAAFCGRRLQGTSRAPSHIAEMLITSMLIPSLSLYWRLRGAWRYGAWVV